MSHDRVYFGHPDLSILARFVWFSRSGSIVLLHTTCPYTLMTCHIPFPLIVIVCHRFFFLPLLTTCLWNVVDCISLQYIAYHCVAVALQCIGHLCSVTVLICLMEPVFNVDHAMVAVSDLNAWFKIVRCYGNKIEEAAIFLHGRFLPVFVSDVCFFIQNFAYLTVCNLQELAEDHGISYATSFC